MAIQGRCLLLTILILVVISAAGATSFFNRSSFPAGFIFGTASASYQYEGAAKESGRGPSIWDHFAHKYPGRIMDGSNGDVAIDFYHKYKEDVQIMKEMGMDAFRFSISWSRILPRGRICGGVNKEGVEFYSNLIDEIVSKGLKPFVTMFHWDLPQELEDEYGGFLSPQIIDDFGDFAELCYKEFGDRVKHWITLNEPWSYAFAGYDQGQLAPGRCSKWVSPLCQAGDSATEPYLVAHHLLLSHAAAVKLYKKKYQGFQKGKIGITLVSHWMVPYSKTKQQKKAAERALDFMFGWFMNPLTLGDYPHSMHLLVRKRLPKFTKDQSMMVNGSFDFVGINYYTSNYAANAGFTNNPNISYSTDARVLLSTERNGISIGQQAASSWLCVYPRGFRNLLFYIKERYNNPTIYITENGIDEFNNSTISLEEALKDPKRIDYYYRHLQSLQTAINDGVKVKGYFAWSLLDNYEWASGYTVRFGLNFIDYKDGFKRYPKDSAIWFKKFLLK